MAPVLRSAPAGRRSQRGRLLKNSAYDDAMALLASYGHLKRKKVDTGERISEGKRKGSKKEEKAQGTTAARATVNLNGNAALVKAQMKAVLGEGKLNAVVRLTSKDASNMRNLTVKQALKRGMDDEKRRHGKIFARRITLDGEEGPEIYDIEIPGSSKMLEKVGAAAAVGTSAMNKSSNGWGGYGVGGKQRKPRIKILSVGVVYPRPRRSYMRSCKSVGVGTLEKAESESLANVVVIDLAEGEEEVKEVIELDEGKENDDVEVVELDGDMVGVGDEDEDEDEVIVVDDEEMEVAMEAAPMAEVDMEEDEEVIDVGVEEDMNEVVEDVKQIAEVMEDVAEDVKEVAEDMKDVMDEDKPQLQQVAGPSSSSQESGQVTESVKVTKQVAGENVNEDHNYGKVGEEPVVQVEPPPPDSPGNNQDELDDSPYSPTQEDETCSSVASAPSLGMVSELSSDTSSLSEGDECEAIRKKPKILNLDSPESSTADKEASSSDGGGNPPNDTVEETSESGGESEVGRAQGTEAEKPSEAEGMDDSQDESESDDDEENVENSAEEPKDDNEASDIEVGDEIEENNNDLIEPSRDEPPGQMITVKLRQGDSIALIEGIRIETVSIPDPDPPEEPRAPLTKAALKYVTVEHADSTCPSSPPSPQPCSSRENDTDDDDDDDETPLASSASSASSDSEVESDEDLDTDSDEDESSNPESNSPSPSSFYCDLCPISFNHKGTLVHHIISRHCQITSGVKVWPFRCAICTHRGTKSSFNRRVDLKNHLENHISEQQSKRFKPSCSCGKIFQNAFMKAFHMQKCHGGGNGDGGAEQKDRLTQGA